MKIVVITGASDGIGAEMARRLASSHDRIDALINNAGLSAQALFDSVRAQDLGWYEQLIRVNLWGSVWCTRVALPHLKKAAEASWQYRALPACLACRSAQPTAQANVR